MATTAEDVSQLSFEAALARLEEIVRTLERGASGFRGTEIQTLLSNAGFEGGPPSMPVVAKAIAETLRLALTIDSDEEAAPEIDRIFAELSK